MLEAFDRRRYLIPFRSLLLPHIFTDTLVIGAGVAGMRAALEAAGTGVDAEATDSASNVILLHKADIDLSSTAWAQGGIAAAMAEDDSVQGHFDDTLTAGDGLCNPDAVRVLCEDAGLRMRELIAWGMRFDRDEHGEISLGREGGHHAHRILHAGGAATGAELVRCLAERVNVHPRIRRFDHCFALDLLTIGDDAQRSGSTPTVHGAITHHPRYGLQIIWAKSTILACGGAGQVYRETTGPRTNTGDGIAMAYRAGAEVADLEFMQFHPTTLYVAGSTRALISEAVRGEGAYIVDRQGRRFVAHYHEMGELAPRDVVSRAIADHLAQTQDDAVYLDARHFKPGRFASHFPNLHALLTSFDLDPETDLIPVHPSAHYTLGGVWTDLDGRTSLPGLSACGECACLGLHGANRLASNSLLEGLAFGARAGRAAAERRAESTGPFQIVSDIHVGDHAELDLADVTSSLRSAMWRNVGIERSGPRLSDVVSMFDFWARYTLDAIFDEPRGWETQNLMTAGALISRAAGWREESRGVHFRRDFPQQSDALRVHAKWRKGCTEPPLDRLPIEESAAALSA